MTKIIRVDDTALPSRMNRVSEVKMRSAVAVADGAGVEIREINDTLYVWKYAPPSLGLPSRHQLYISLCNRAARKLGYTNDKRYRSGWRHNGHAIITPLQKGQTDAE